MRVSVWVGSSPEVDFIIHYVAVHMSSVFSKRSVLPFSVLDVPKSVTSLVHLFQRISFLSLVISLKGIFN